MREETDSPKMVSSVENVQASDGTTFDILRNAPAEAAKLRGDALVAMRKIAEEREPELSQYLKTGSGTSAEYAMSSALIHSNNPDVKSDLLTVLVDENLAEGHRDSAIRMLAYANSSELPVAEKYGEAFCLDQFNKSLEEDEPDDAWSISNTVTKEGGKITEQEWPQSEEWKSREKTAFDAWATKVLETPIEEDVWNLDTMELQTMFDFMRFREDGFNADQPSDLSRKIADKRVQLELKRGRSGPALSLAVDANMPEDYVKGIKQQARREEVQSIIKSVEQKFNKVRSALKGE